MTVPVLFFGTVFAVTFVAMGSILGVDSAIFGAIVGVWLRMEHRLTKVEGKFDSLPCKDDAKGKKCIAP